MITYDEALSAARGGNAVFILGAGFSCGAINSRGDHMLNGMGLKNKIADLVGFPQDYQLDVVSQQYINNFGSKALANILKEEYLVNSFDEKYALFAQLKKAHIYTTNYDNLVERIFAQEERNLNSYVLEDNCKKSAKGLFILHINGRISEDTEDVTTIRLSLGSYDSDFTVSPWIKYLADDLSSSDAIFVIGHSLLGDLDLRRMLVDYSQKCFIIQPPKINDNERKILADYGRVCENGVFQFLEDLAKAQTPQIVDNISQIKLKSFKRLINEQVLEEASDQEVFDFFVKGDSSRNVFFQNLDKKFVSLINRHQLSQVAELLQSGKNIVLHADLGNGKSIFLRQLIRFLPNKKFLIFEQNNTSDYQKELRTLCACEEEIVVVFDPYNACYDSIEYLKNVAGKNIQFILIARSAMHENFEKRVEEDLNSFQISYFDLNLLNNEECAELNAILKKYGLWGKDVSLSDERRMDILTKKCESYLQEIILYLFESSEMKKRFESLIGAENNANYKKLLILSFINSVLELKLKTDDFNILYRELDVYRIYRSELFKEFVYYQRGSGWLIKSPIVSKAMLNSNVFSKKEIIKDLVELTLKLDELYEGCNTYINALKNLGSCSYLSFIFNYDFDKKELLDYFEAVKVATFNQNSYFFWLQYAIACVNTKMYDRAKKYFESAYSFAERRGRSFSTYQIDNHYARYLLDHQIDSRNPTNSYDVFMEAHRLLMKSKCDAKSENKYYQFRVARSYRDYYNIFYKNFKNNEKEKFIFACKEIKKDLQIYEAEIRRERDFLRNDVFECKQNIDYILSNYETIKE